MSTNPKLKVINNHAYANSLDLAKHFRKYHFHVVRDIENAINDTKSGGVDAAETEILNSFSSLNFEESTYRDGKGELRRMFHLSRDGFAFIAMGFTGAKAKVWKIRYINAFNEMESELNRRAVKHREFGQLKLQFPEIAETIEDGYPSMTVSYAIARLTELGLMIPPVSRQQIINLIKRGKLEGFNDGRQWSVYADSFNRFVKLRSGQFV